MQLRRVGERLRDADRLRDAQDGRGQAADEDRAAGGRRHRAVEQVLLHEDHRRQADGGAFPVRGPRVEPPRLRDLDLRRQPLVPL